MKRTPLKKKSKRTQPWFRKKAVEVAKLIAKHRDMYTCQRCGKRAENGYQIHGSHIFPEGKYHTMSTEPDNIKALCARCHMDWHENPVMSVEWLKGEKPDLYKELKERSHLNRKKDYEKEYQQLREEYKSVIN